MIDEFQFPTPESKLITFHIGAVCVNWSSIDASLGFILGIYMKVEPAQWDVATSIIDLSRKCELVKALSFIYDERKSHNRLAKALNFLDGTLRPIRNRYVHDSYSFFTGGHIRKIYKTQIINVQSFQKELRTRRVEGITVEEISTFNSDLDACSMVLTAHLLNLMVDREVAKPDAMRAMIAVSEGYYQALEAVMKRHASKKV